MDLTSAAQLLGNLGEFVGAIAVVITLVYLAIQIRQNTVAINHSREVDTARTFIARTEQRIEISRVIAESEDLAAILARVDSNSARTNLKAIDDLPPTDLRRLFSLYRMQALNAESIIFQRRAGLVDDELYENTRRFVARSANVWLHMDVLNGFRETFIREVEIAQREVGSSE